MKAKDDRNIIKFAKQEQILDERIKVPLENWFWRDAWRIYQDEPRDERPGVVLGAAIWGQKYIDNFLKWCLPSIVSARNLAALRASKSRIVLVTDVAGLQWLMPAVFELDKLGLAIQVLNIPPDVIVEWDRNPGNKYWICGMAHGVLIKHSARLGMGFHMLMPDHVYSRDYFGNLLRIAQSVEAVAQNTVSATMEPALKELAAWKAQDGTISIASRELCALGFRHLHKQMRMYQMGPGQKDYPNSHFMMWTGEDRLWIFSPHANAAWMSHRLCLNAPIRTPATMDSQLPWLMPNGAYCPAVEDDMGVIEISGEEKAWAPRVPVDKFLVKCSTSVELHPEYMPWFKAPYFVPIARQKKFQTPQQIMAEHASIVRQLEAFMPRLRDRVSAAMEAKESEFDVRAMLAEAAE